MATQRTKIGGVSPAASQHALDTAVSGKPAGGPGLGAAGLGPEPRLVSKGNRRPRSRQIGLALLGAAAAGRCRRVPHSISCWAERSVLAGPTSRQLCDGGWVAKTVVSPWLPPAARPSSLHSLSQPQREASGLRNERNAVQLTERDRNDRRSIGSGTLCDAAVASRVSLEAASHVVAGDGWADKLQPGGWPAYTCNKPPNTTDGRHHQWLIASHSGGSAPPEKPASSFSRRATTVGEVKPERQSNRANTKSVAPQHSYAVGFLPRLFLHDGNPVFATAELPLPGPRSGRLVQGICWTPPRSTSDPVSLTMAGPSISP